MLKYIIQTDKLFEVLDVLYRVLGVGISFFDCEFKELSFFDSQKQSPYCRIQRQCPDFLGRCKSSDYKLFNLARQTGRIQVHFCHCGLIDGCVPLSDDNNEFLGIIIYGQIRPRGHTPPKNVNHELKELYLQLPQLRRQQAEDIGKLLKLISESIVREQMVVFKKLGWSEKVQRYIDMHINEPITISKLADLVGKSESFISHNFLKDFGQTPAQYILAKKMDIAKNLLKGGDRVNQVARKLGFYDEFHFSKSFKKFFKKPPNEFKGKN